MDCIYILVIPRMKNEVLHPCIINIRSAPNKINEEVDLQSDSVVLTIVDLAGAEREKRTGNQYRIL
ncbi:hypothetical protein CsSME_00036295 [Camellia sinensis var. sinensis]